MVEQLVGRAVGTLSSWHSSSVTLHQEACSPKAFKEGFSAIAEFIYNTICDAPKALEVFAIVLKGADLDAITRDAPLEVTKRIIGPCFLHSAIGGSSREHVGWAWCTRVEFKYSEKHDMSTSLFKLSIRCPP